MARVLVNLLSLTGTKGGMETYSRELYRAIISHDSGHEFIGLVSSQGARQDLSWFPGEIINSGISGENRFAWAYGELFGVAKHAEKCRAELVHSTATLSPRKTSMPSVVTMHDMLYWSNPELMSTKMYTQPVKWMEKQGSANAKRIITISDVSAAAIVRYLDVDPDRVDVIPLAGTAMPGVDRSLATTAAPMILATGNRRPHKNWAGLIRALPLIAPEIRPRLTITGSHGKDPLEKVVAETGMEQWVQLHGWLSREEMAHLYSTATIMAMPSFVDGFCLPALEAMMVGLPVLISDIPVYREVVGDAAIFINPHDLKSIADGMRKAVTDQTLMSSLVTRGLERSSQFSWNRTAAGTLASFAKALAD